MGLTLHWHCPTLQNFRGQCVAAPGLQDHDSPHHSSVETNRHRNADENEFPAIIRPKNSAELFLAPIPHGRQIQHLLTYSAPAVFYDTGLERASDCRAPGIRILCKKPPVLARGDGGRWTVDGGRWTVDEGRGTSMSTSTSTSTKHEARSTKHEARARARARCNGAARMTGQGSDFHVISAETLDCDRFFLVFCPAVGLKSGNVLCWK